jgi:hypothetical protein
MNCPGSGAGRIVHHPPRPIGIRVMVHGYILYAVDVWGAACVKAVTFGLWTLVFFTYHVAYCVPHSGAIAVCTYCTYAVRWVR